MGELPNMLQRPLYANKRIRITPAVVTRIQRLISGEPAILSKVGQEVSPQDLLGRGKLSGGFRKINLAEQLNLSPIEVKKYLQRKIGQRIYQGELLAYKPGSLFQSKRVLVSPSDGVLNNYNEKTGELTVGFLPKTIDVPAAVYGIIESINQNTGQIIIKTYATEIYGVVGSGFSRGGLLEIMDGREDLIDAARITEKFRERIIVGGGLFYSAAFITAAAVGVHGIISGGINAKDFQSLSGGTLDFPLKIGRDTGISVVATEGFGTIPISEDLFAILENHRRKFAIIDGNRAKVVLPSYTSDCMVTIRQTKLPPLRSGSLVETIPEIEAVVIKIGQRARVIATPYMGEQGVIISIDRQPTLLPSGIYTWMVMLETRSKKIKIPHPNVEVID